MRVNSPFLFPSLSKECTMLTTLTFCSIPMKPALPKTAPRW